MNNNLYKGRIFFVLLLLSMIAVFSGFVLYIFRNEVSFFYTPTDFHNDRVPVGKEYRMGGLVKYYSVQQDRDGSIRFVVTDMVSDIEVHYRGIVPALFRENSGVVAIGCAGDGGKVFAASRLLAKHDEKYTPPVIYNNN